MASTETIPITIEPAAAARVEELGMRRELDQMLEYLKHHVPGLRGVTVELDAEANLEDEPSIIIDTRQDEPRPGENDDSHFPWYYFMGDTFPPDICRHFVRLSTYEAPDGR
jgi:hypothetical protein